jgi:hypothetical protein
VSTLGGNGLIVLGVTTLRGIGAFAMSFVLSVVCDIVCRDRGMGEANIGFDDSARHGHRVTFGGAAGSVGGGVCHILSLKIATDLASAEMVSSPTRANGT